MKTFNFDEFMQVSFSEESLKKTQEEGLIKKYIDIVNNVLEQKRDKKLMSLFDNYPVSMRTVIETIEHCEKEKEKFEERFRKSVKVRRTFESKE